MPPRTDRWKCVWLISAGALLLSWLLLIPAFPQQTKPPDKKAGQDERKRPDKPELEQKTPQAGKGYQIGVNVDLVVIHTTVVDKNGKFVSGLKQENFKIYEDGVMQNIMSFSQEDAPVSLGIVIDTSGSMRNKFDSVTKAALAFIRASNPDDEAFLIGFNDEVQLITDYTNDIEVIADDLENTVVTGGTALWDAIYLAVQKAQAGSKAKKALIVITDGEDRDSYYKLDEMVAKVQESDVQIYGIGFLNEIPDKGLFGRWTKTEPEKAHDALQRISDETGGKAFFPKDTGEIHNIVSQIAYELRNQYSISFSSSNSARDGTWRRLKVALESAANNGWRVRYRNGYFAAKPAANK